MVEVSDMVPYIPLITSIIASVIAIISIILTKRSNVELEKIRSTMSRERDAEAALRDYQYEARKRLYLEFEPLLFLLIEQSDHAINRIYNIALTAKKGNLGINYHAFSNDASYYTRSTFYRLLIPLATFKLMQEKLTMFDLDLIPYYRSVYFLSKTLYFTFSDEYEFKELYNDLQLQTRETENMDKMGIQNNLHYDKRNNEGIFTGLLDNAVNALIKRSNDNRYNIKTFGEFEKDFLDETENKSFDRIKYLFLNFHPKQKPLLWTILLTQLHIYKSILESYEQYRITKRNELDFSQKPNFIIKINLLTRNERESKLDWRYNKDEASDFEVLSRPYKIIERYLNNKLNETLEIKKNYDLDN
jgi:hypothetical protein